MVLGLSSKEAICELWYWDCLVKGVICELWYWDCLVKEQSEGVEGTVGRVLNKAHLTKAWI